MGGVWFCSELETPVVQPVAWLCGRCTCVDAHVASYGWQGVLVELQPKCVEG